MSHEPPKYKTTKFQNWGKNINCEVDQIWEPATKEDLIWIVKEAYARKKKVRAVGDGHSWSPMWFHGKDKNAWIVKSNKLNHKGWDGENKRIKVGPGVLIGELMKIELQVGHCVPVQVVLQEVMIGGVIGTGCHGTGLERNTVSDYVYSMTLILWDGSERTITKADGDLFDAVKSGFGAFGLVWEIEFDTVPQPIVRVRDFKIPVSDLYDVKDPSKLKKWVTEHDYTEVFWFPLNTKDLLWVKTFKYAPDKIPDDKPTLHQKFGLLAVPASHIFAFLENKVPKWVPKVSDTFLLGLDSQDSIQHLSYAMHFQDYLEEYAAMLDTEICIEISDDYSNVVEAFTSIINITREWEKKGKYPLNVCLECRFIANSDALLSPAYGPKGSHHCYIEIISYDNTPGFDDYMRECILPWFTQKKWNAIPHLGKYWQRLNDPEIGFDIEEYVRKQMGDRFTRFVKVRDEIDPHNMFLNKFLEDFFHPRKSKSDSTENEHVAFMLSGINEKFARIKVDDSSNANTETQQTVQHA